MLGAVAVHVPFSDQVSGLPREANRYDGLVRAKQAFESILLASAFKPLASSLGFYGDFVVEACTQAMLRDSRGLAL